MPTDKETMTLCCDECGADKVITPDDLDDSSVILCDVCGVAHGKWGSINEEFTKMFAKPVQGTFGDALSDIKGTKFIKSDL
jgi:hypothetical protein